MDTFTHLHCDIVGDLAHVTFPGGKFDGVAVRELFELSNQLPDVRPKLLVDTTGVEFVPSGAMGMLIMIRKRFMSAGGQLHIAIPSADIMQSFTLANMGRMLELFETVEDALSRFKP